MLLTAELSLQQFDTTDSELRGDSTLAMLAQRLERIEIDGEPSFGTPPGIYGLESLPLRLTWAG